MQQSTDTPSSLSSKSEMSLSEQAFVSRFLHDTIGCDFADCPLELAEEIFHELTRQEEVLNTTRDPLGRWQADLSPEYNVDQAAIPRIDALLARLEEERLPQYSNGKVRPRWPEGKPFALCLSHDVDYVSTRGHSARFLRRFGRVFTAGGSKQASVKATAASLYRIATALGGSERYGHYERWLQLEQKFGFRSTFYFCPSKITRPHVFDTDYRYSDTVFFDGSKMTVAEMIRQLKKSGWDIGLHGSYYSAGSAQLLVEQKKELESVVGEPVLSCRQHYLQYDVTRTPGFQSDAGFLADSTQGFTQTIGFRAKTSLPYRCWNFKTGSTLPILEIPLHVMDTALFYGYNAPSSEEEAVQRVITLMDNVERVHGCLTLNWHPHNMMRPALWNTYCRVLEEAHRRGAWGCSVEQLMQWWKRGQ